MAPLEIWGGTECTINRVHDQFIDQTRLTGHELRPSDLDLFASLGIRRIRQPVLWERVAPDGLAAADWSWTDQCLCRLQGHGIHPIVGLVHHGSGPRGTSLLDAEFPGKLAAYARAVASRYPWVDDWTPINEPVTTARFSTLYGIWYPHACAPSAFVRALLNQCRGIAMAMREIRSVNPRARLIQTEDCGRVRGTKILGYQSDFENLRQRAAFDLLMGEVSRRHPLWRYLTQQGASSAELDWFTRSPCPPEVLGVNYYVTSDRYLDHRVDAYPACTPGGNGHHRYVDVEAARVAGVGIDGHLDVLRRLWRDYGRTLALTEVHLGGTRDDQLRWLAEAWTAVGEARAQGIPVQALTAWSLLGAYGWDQLVSAPDGRYESGVYDLRSDPPRPTALVDLIKTLAGADLGNGNAAALPSPGFADHHPVLRTRGWWRRPDGVLYHPDHCPKEAVAGNGASRVTVPGRSEPAGPDPDRAAGELWSARVFHAVASLTSPEHEPLGAAAAVSRHSDRSPLDSPRPILITGGGCTLGRAIARVAAGRGLAIRTLTRDEFNIADLDLIQPCVERYRPWAVINAAGYAGVDDAEREPEQCWRDNVAGPVALARVCRRSGIPLLTFSSDHVFDGRSDRPYQEHDLPSPLGVYGRTQWEAELRILDILPEALVIRSAALFGSWDQSTFVHRVLQTLVRGATFHAAHDLVVSPTYIPDLVHAALDLLIDGENGIWHVANGGALSWAELARRAARGAGYSPGLIQAHPYQHLGMRALRPPFSALATRRGQLLRSVDDALGACLHERLHGVPSGAVGRHRIEEAPTP
jgi:dTDP-4-dehydrorhamnose reductase